MRRLDARMKLLMYAGLLGAIVANATIMLTWGFSVNNATAVLVCILSGVFIWSMGR